MGLRARGRDRAAADRARLGAEHARPRSCSARRHAGATPGSARSRTLARREVRLPSSPARSSSARSSRSATQSPLDTHDARNAFGGGTLRRSCTHTLTASTRRPPRLSFADEAEIDVFVDTLDALRARRARRRRSGAPSACVHGVYGQRQDGRPDAAHQDPAGHRSTRPQLEALADVAERYSRGFGHVTTRQNVQFHFVSSTTSSRRCAGSPRPGITTQEACGNSVRNLTALPVRRRRAGRGVRRDAVRRGAHAPPAAPPARSTLPRKFKIAFEGCPEDHVLAAINDLGFRARVRRERRARRGFRVTVARRHRRSLPTSARAPVRVPAGGRDPRRSPRR